MSAGPLDHPAAALASLFDLGGKVALVTGGAGAIGWAICSRLAEAGASVWCLDKAAPPPGKVRGFAIDVTDPVAVNSAIDEIGTVTGRLDIVVHAAGITRDARLWKTGTDEWSLVLETNLTSAFHVLHAAVPLLRRTGAGAVVLVSSINGERGKIGQSAYAASKGGLNALARTAARELGAFHIRVNAIAPGWIDTPMTATVPEPLRLRALDESALGRLGEPDDIARATMFLVSDLGRHVTGQIVRVDGGQLIG